MSGEGVKDRLLRWLDARTGFRTAQHVLLDEEIPAGTGWVFTLGSVLLALISVQLLTGAFLTLYYAPTPDHAYESVRFISSTTSGRLVRGLHHFGASFLVVVHGPASACASSSSVRTSRRARSRGSPAWRFWVSCWPSR